MKVAYLACADTLSTNPERRPDSYEQDRELETFVPAFAARGLELIEIDWRACRPEDFDLLFVRTTWDYVDREAEFLDFLDRASRSRPVANAPALIRWNLSKHYLRELAEAGLPVIPSVFTDTPLPLDEVFARLDADEIVLKPVVGAGGYGQERLSRVAAQGRWLEPQRFAQPLIPSIATAGELSFIFVSGRFSHAVRKTPASGEYRIHVVHGGAEHPYAPSPAEIAEAAAFIQALPVPALAARVDMVPHKGRLLLMEVEAIEPHLFPLHGPNLGALLADACLASIGH